MTDCMLDVSQAIMWAAIVTVLPCTYYTAMSNFAHRPLCGDKLKSGLHLLVPTQQYVYGLHLVPTLVATGARTE